MIRSVLMLAPEAPYPLQGGGAYRTASLLHYFARFAEVDLILISESGEPALLPSGLVRTQIVLPLPVHSRSTVARYLRNARRAIRGVPPLVDRLGGLDSAIAAAVRGRSYDLGVIEHFWCAPYLKSLEPVCARTVLDLHNVESVLDSRCASVSGGLVAAGHRRFANLYLKMEQDFLPRFSLVLAPSEQDAAVVREIAPETRLSVFPNAIPFIELPISKRRNGFVFSSNFEYHPNIDAVGYFVSEIWPAIRAAHPEQRLRLVGRGDHFIRHLLPGGMGIETTGSIEDAFAEIASAQIVVAPLRAGSGTRIKILEAWAAGRPVVATPLAAEGLAASDGENILLANDSGSFIVALKRLLENPAEAERLGRNGRLTYEERYTWPAAWRNLDPDILNESDALRR